MVKGRTTQIDSLISAIPKRWSLCNFRYLSVSFGFTIYLIDKEK